jgi:hypothetical protein
VVIFVILDKSLRLDTFPLGEKGQYLQHIVAPAICFRMSFIPTNESPLTEIIQLLFTMMSSTVCALHQAGTSVAVALISSGTVSADEVADVPSMQRGISDSQQGAKTVADDRNQICFAFRRDHLHGIAGERRIAAHRGNFRMVP